MSSNKKHHMSNDMRELIIKLHKEKKSLRQIAKIVGKTHSTVQSVVKKFEMTGSVNTLPRSGRPKILNSRDRRNIIRKVNENPRISAPKLAVDVELEIGKIVHPENIRRILRKSGLNGRIPRKKPFISLENRRKRLEFAKKYGNEDEQFWNKVLFTDESKFNIFGPDSRGKIWRKKNTELEEKNLIPTVKHGGGCVMVWGSMAAAGVGSLVFIQPKMDRWVYLDIIKSNLKSDAAKLKLGNNWIFQQDQDPKHTAHVVKSWLLYNVPKQLHSPPQSPDLNPIEHVWDYLDRHRIRKHRITNVNMLKNILLEEWNKIPPSYTEKLVSSMNRRLKACVNAKGCSTKY